RGARRELAMCHDRDRREPEPDELGRAEVQRAAAVVAPEELDEEPCERVEADERQEHLAVVALPPVHPEEEERRDRERRRRLVDLRRVDREGREELVSEEPVLVLP